MTSNNLKTGKRAKVEKVPRIKCQTSHKKIHAIDLLLRNFNGFFFLLLLLFLSFFHFSFSSCCFDGCGWIQKFSNFRRYKKSGKWNKFSTFCGSKREENENNVAEDEMGCKVSKVNDTTTLIENYVKCAWVQEQNVRWKQSEKIPNMC